MFVPKLVDKPNAKQPWDPNDPLLVTDVSGVKHFENPYKLELETIVYPSFQLQSRNVKKCWNLTKVCLENPSLTLF